GYDDRAVVDGLQLHIAPGNLVSLLGPSGCGKTTALRAIAGFQPVTSGEIRLNGKIVSSPGVRVPPEQRNLGMVFQDYALFPHLTVSENIAFGLRHHTAGSKQQVVDCLLELIGMEGYGNRYPAELSGGQQQRIAVARALAPEPSLLLLDEPFSNLDVELRERLAIDVRDMLRSQNATAIFVTHDQNEAFVMGDKIGVMNEGRMLQWDTAFNLYHEPNDRFIADFIGKGSFLRGELASADTVTTALGRLSGNRAYPWPEGTPVDILVRPDDVLIVEESPTRCRVTDRAFMGADTLYTLRLDDGVELLSLMPSRYDYAIGSEVGIELDIDHFILFPLEPIVETVHSE
ncbi:MAG: ABC transporter ATP-binding protein, partial [Gammaproteobacteria bacterium]|nr:ABC transporter ATP-binding protein [Gammaproteobacteria bacterium]